VVNAKLQQQLVKEAQSPDGGLVLLPESTSLTSLSTDEVIAIRLYTGPGYVPLNSYLRNLAKASPEWRQKLSQMYQLTYSTTIFHLTNGLRKLVRCNRDFSNVYRGLRGELPEAFWLHDDFGFVTATDFAFMSTSLDVAVCKEYMRKTEPNVLWEIECSAETAEGFHSGADVSLLSQFPQEREMLFPPMTMLKVKQVVVAVSSPDGVKTIGPRRRSSAVMDPKHTLAALERTDPHRIGEGGDVPAVERRASWKQAARKLEVEATEKGAQFTRVIVTPTFV
jgi:hypothetical protein